MNRYTRAGVLADMRAGKNVLVLVRDTMHIIHALNDIASGMEPGEGVARAHGHERVWRGNAAVRFRSIHSSMRGLTFDVIVVDTDWNNIAAQTQWELEHLVCLRGDIIRWT